MIGLPGKLCSFFCSNSKTERREVGTTVKIGSCVPIILGALLACTDLVANQALDAASVEGEPNDKVCEKADASASVNLKWKDFGFPVSKMERGENVTLNLLDFLEFCHTIKKK